MGLCSAVNPKAVSKSLLDCREGLIAARGLNISICKSLQSGLQIPSDAPGLAC